MAAFANIIAGLLSIVAAVIYSGQTIYFVQKLNELIHWKSGCNPVANVGNVTLYYFEGRGRAEMIRFLLEDFQIPYAETKYTSETWLQAKQYGIEAGVFTFGQVPAIVTSRKKHLVQSKVIVQYIGRSVGVDCDCYDLEKCDIIAAGVEDVHQKRNKYIWNPDFSHKLREEYINTVLLQWLQHFERFAPYPSAESEGRYFASDRLTWVDYIVFEMIDSNCNFVEYTAEQNMTTEGYIGTCESLLTNFPNLNGFYNSFKSRANIDKYLKSESRPVYKLP